MKTRLKKNLPFLIKRIFPVGLLVCAFLITVVYSGLFLQIRSWGGFFVFLTAAALGWSAAVLYNISGISEKRLAAIEAAGDGIGIVDHEGRLVYMNRALMTLHGLTPADAPRYIGKGWEMLYSEKGRADIMRAVMPALEKNGFWRGESPIVRADGGIVTAEMTLTLLEDGGFIGTARDVTERKKAIEEKENLHRQFLQAQKMESVGRLTGGIAHDFNNLLTVISGNLELLEDIFAGLPEAKKPAEAIYRAVTRGADLTQRLLAFSRRQVLKPQVININDVIPETVKLIRRAMNDSIEIATRLAADLRDTEIDVSQLENALLNMAINARDAMPDGGLLTIATSNVAFAEDSPGRAPYMDPGKYVVITVSDTGEGIPPEIVSRIFEPFFTTKGVGEGSGLGLSMVYGFVKQSGGYVTVESTPGHGTVFRLYFPRSAQAARPAAEAPADHALPGGRETILLVEDEPGILEISEALLRKNGYQVRAAVNGAEAVLLLEKMERCDLLLTDIMMPGGIDGKEVAVEAKTLFPGVKVLFVSGYAPEGQAPLPAGGVLLPKPYSRESLLQAVRKLLDS